MLVPKRYIDHLEKQIMELKATLEKERETHRDELQGLRNYNTQILDRLLVKNGIDPVAQQSEGVGVGLFEEEAEDLYEQANKGRFQLDSFAQ